METFFSAVFQPFLFISKGFFIDFMAEITKKMSENEQKIHSLIFQLYGYYQPSGFLMFLINLAVWSKIWPSGFLFIRLSGYSLLDKSAHKYKSSELEKTGCISLCCQIRQ